MAKELTAGGTSSERRDPRTQETPTQRWNRSYLEILHETRAAQIGTQLLLVFLLTLAFTSRFDETTRFQRMVYVVSLVLVAGATCLLIAPAPFHRLVFRRRLEAQLVRASSRFAFWGITLMMLAVNGVLLLILDVVMGTFYALPITAGTLLWFVTWWYFAPAWTRLGQRRRRRETTIAVLEAASEKLRSEKVRSERLRPAPDDPGRALDAAAEPRGLPAPRPPQLRSGPTWPAPRLPMMPAPVAPQAGSDQLGYPGGRVPAVGFDRPSPQPGAAAGPNAPYVPSAPGLAPVPNPGSSSPFGPLGPDARPGPALGPVRNSGPVPRLSPAPYGPIGRAAANGPNGPVPVGDPAPPSGPAGVVGGVRSGIGGPTGGYAAVDPLGPLAIGGPYADPVPFDGAAARGPQGRHHGISLTDLPVHYTTGDVPRLHADGGMQHGLAGNGMQHGLAGNGMQHGLADNGMQHGSAGNGMQHGSAGNGMQHGSAGNGMQHGLAGNGMQHGLAGNGMQHGSADGGMQHGSADGGMQHGSADGGMQHGRADDGVTQFGVALPFGPAPTGGPAPARPVSGLPAPGGSPGETGSGLPTSGLSAFRGEAAPTPAGAAGPATAGPAVAGPAPAGPTDTGSYPLYAGEPVDVEVDYDDLHYDEEYDADSAGSADGDDGAAGIRPTDIGSALRGPVESHPDDEPHHGAADAGSPGRDGVVGRARVTPPHVTGPRHGFPMAEGA